MTRPDDDSLMLAYVYGELSDDETRAFEARLAADPELRAEVDGLVATRDLLQEDARFGEVSGADLPPPHLADAILRAEALARPPEVRRAHAAGGGGGSFLARVQVWLVGGGLVAGAAAALLLVAKEGDMPEPQVVGHAPAQVAKANDRRASAAEERPLGSSTARAVPAGEAQTGGIGLDEQPALEPPADAPLEEAEASATLDTLAARGERSRRQVDAKPERKAATKGDKAARATRARPKPDGFGAGDGEAFASDALVEQRADAAKEEGAATTRDRRAAEPMANAEAPRELALADDEASPGAGLVGSAGTGGRTSAGGAPSGSLSTGAPAASAPATAAPPAPPPLPDVVKRELAKKRAEQKRAPARAKAKAKAAAPSKQQALADALDMTLVTAEQELQSGRAQEALDLFTSVTRRDPRGALTGVLPYVGQMRALHALKRHREVLALLPTVKRPGIRAPGVPEGILVAAKSAEALGDPLLARSLYRELLVVKDKRQEAEAALERLDASPAVRAKAAREYEYDSADADEGAAAAPPAEE